MTTLFLDLETVPQGWQLWGRDVLEGRPPELALQYAVGRLQNRNPPSNYGPEARERWWARQYEGVQQDACRYYQEGSLDPKLGQILAIGAAVTHVSVHGVDPRPPVCIWAKEDERQGLVELLALLETVRPDRIVAWNGEGFDFPWLWERGLGQGLPQLARWFSPLRYGQRVELGANKPGTLVDPCRLWSTTRESSRKLSVCAGMLGIQVQDQITGADVLESMVNGQDDKVREHVLADIAKLRQLWERMAPALGVSLE